ncbi:MAG: CHAP domain-containing protein [Bacillota bacterium]|nr:CHAP domain-containing protein [Bacillota bacterium]
MVKLNRLFSALLSTSLILTSTSPIFAKVQKDTFISVSGNFVYSDHETYVDMSTGIEYDIETGESISHGCSFYYQYLQSLQSVVPEVPQEPEKEVVEEKVEEPEKIEEAEKVEDVLEKEEEPTQKKEENKVVKDDPNYKEDTWYHPKEINPQGYVGELKTAIKKDNFVTSSWDAFKIASNPFTVGECTYFAWSRFYQVYGYDHGARGCGKQNAAEIVQANSDKFVLSSSPAAGAVYSAEKNTLYRKYGHVGFVEAFDGKNIWLSEGNVEIGDNKGYIWIHKMAWEEFQEMFPDAVFAVPIKEEKTEKKEKKEESITLEIKTPVIQPRILKK